MDEVLDVFNATARLEPVRFVAKDDFLPTVAVIGKLLVETLREMVGVNDELVELVGE